MPETSAPTAHRRIRSGTCPFPFACDSCIGAEQTRLESTCRWHGTAWPTQIRETDTPFYKYL